MAKNIDKDLQEILQEIKGEELANAQSPYGEPSAADLDAAIREANLQQKYGNSELEAAAGSALSGATLGLSDQILRSMGVSSERLRETRERSPIASGLGTTAGVVAPLLVGDSAGVAGAAAKANPVAAPNRICPI